MTTQLAERPFGQKSNPGHSRPATQVIAFVGTGRMGGPMAANLARAGFEVRAWDRTASHAAALVKDGATVAASPGGGGGGGGTRHPRVGGRPRHGRVGNGPGGAGGGGPRLDGGEKAN